jgi:cysteine desulfurase
MNQNKIIYLDNNATTRVDDAVLQAMLPYFTEEYANASSSHLFGLIISETIDTAQEQVANFIGAKPKEITFTSGATEAINLAIKGVSNQTKKHIVTVTTEHKAVLDSCAFMEKIGFDVTYVPVNTDGTINLTTLSRAITDETLLVSVMFANNETGVLHPINEISALAHAKGALFMTDATQAIGKIAIDVTALGIDLMTLSAHKFYGPKGVGALYVSASAKIKLNPQIHGGNHQRKLRSGTLNVPGIVGLGKACEISFSKMHEDQLRITALRDKLEIELLKIEGTFINGTRTQRLYNTANICFTGINSEKLIIALQNIAVSSGSACSAVTSKPSHILKAMGLSDLDALASIRLSLGRFTAETDINFTIAKVTELVKKLRKEY